MADKDYEIKYCTRHGRMVPVQIDQDGNEYHMALAMNTVFFDISAQPQWDTCYGEFAESSPPELTEEQWHAIIAEEV